MGSLSAVKRRTRVIALAFALVATVSAAGCSASITIGATAAPSQTPGTIVFGTSIDTTAWTVGNAATSFRTTDLVGWAARLNDAANSATLTFTLASVDSSGAETNVDTETVNVTNQSDNIFGHAADKTMGAMGAGTYIMRYTRPSDSTVLATGTVTITA
jgi:hypothetical protein